MTRDEVLEEFRSDACENECDATDCIVERAMADEIVRLRDRLAAVEAERDAEKQRRREIDDEAFVYAEQVEVMRRRAGSAERTLAALREPSVAIVRAAQQTWDGDYCHMGVAIRAAVAAAEQEAAGA